MKKFRSIIRLVFLSVSVLFASCVYEPLDGAIDLDNGNIPVNSGVFKADFNGGTWTAAQAQASISGNFIEIAAIKTNGEGFGFLIEAPGVGTYPANINLLSFTPAGTDYGYWSVNDTNPDENTGSITISNINTTKKTISGTFSFKGYWSGDVDVSKLPMQFTNGIFKDVPYITQEQTSDSFFAKVGGVEFKDVDIMTMVIGSGASEFISVGAQDEDLNDMTVSVKSNVTPGTYAITGNLTTDVIQAFYKDDKAVSGSVTITSKTSDRIKGTFKFNTNGTTPFTITEGAFDVEY